MLPCNRTPRPIFYPFSATRTEGERPCTLQPQPISRHLIWLRTTTGGTLNATWRVESVSLPIEQVEVLSGVSPLMVSTQGKRSLQPAQHR